MDRTSTAGKESGGFGGRAIRQRRRGDQEKHFRENDGVVCVVPTTRERETETLSAGKAGAGSSQASGHGHTSKMHWTSDREPIGSHYSQDRPSHHSLRKLAGKSTANAK